MNEKRRTNNTTYYRNQNFYIGDNLARKLHEPERQNEKKRISREAARRQEARKAAQKKEKNFRRAFIAVSAVLVVGFCVMFLSTMSKNTELSQQISSLESQYEALAVLNDSKEYTIDSSVDLNYVIQVATGELGMVRSSASQIKTYDSKATEYVQQVAGIPNK